MSISTVRLTAALTMVAFASACASSTLIRSSPSGAKVYIDGSSVGQTPYQMTDTKIVGATTHVQLKLDGYEDFHGTITRSEEFDVGACIGGVLVLVPFLWIQGYKPERTFEMTPLRWAPPPGQQGAPAYYPPQPYASQPPAYPQQPQQYAPQAYPPAQPQQYAPQAYPPAQPQQYAPQAYPPAQPQVQPQ